MRIGDDHIRKASTQSVRREYELLAFRDGEGVEDFAMRLVAIIHHLATLGDPELDNKEEWCEKAKNKEEGEGSHGGSNGDHGGRGRGGRNRARGRGRGGHGDNSSAPGGCKNNSSCHRCGKPGH
jgi:hypothetical protein